MKSVSVVALLFLSVLMVFGQSAFAETLSFPSMAGVIYNHSSVDLNNSVLEIQINCNESGLFNNKSCGDLALNVPVTSDGHFTLPRLNFISTPSFFKEVRYHFAILLVSSDFNLKSVIYSGDDLLNLNLFSQIYPRMGQISLIDLPTSGLSVVSDPAASWACPASYNISYALTLLPVDSLNRATAFPAIVNVYIFTNLRQGLQVNFERQAVGFIGADITIENPFSVGIVIGHDSAVTDERTQFFTRNLISDWGKVSELRCR